MISEETPQVMEEPQQMAIEEPQQAEPEETQETQPETTEEMISTESEEVTTEREVNQDFFREGVRYVVWLSPEIDFIQKLYRAEEA